MGAAVGATIPFHRNMPAGLIPAALAAGAAAADGNFGGLPAGKGRALTYHVCSACRSIRLVVQQRLTREDWDEALVWMVKEQDMPRLDPAERKLILDYLSKYYSREMPR